MHHERRPRAPQRKPEQDADKAATREEREGSGAEQKASRVQVEPDCVAQRPPRTSSARD